MTTAWNASTRSAAANRHTPGRRARSATNFLLANALGAALAVTMGLSAPRRALGEGTPLTPPPPTAAPSASESGRVAASASASAPPGSTPVPWANASGGDTREGLDPFPSTGRYLSYGFAFHSESLLAPGSVCPKEAIEQCVLGAGGGISFSGALRTPRYSLGAMYEATFHDSNNIYQRAVLQQLRGEWRLRPRELAFSESFSGFVGAGGGLAMYGDNWGVATQGAIGTGSIGTEFDLGVKVSLVFAIAYRAIYFRSFTDASGESRPAGLAHLLGLTLGMELHEPL